MSDIIPPSVLAARACIGTPFHHQGRAANTGLDCIGLVIIALRAEGILVRDRTDYGRRPDGKSLADALLSHGATLTDMIQAGDVLLFRFDGQPQHVALATDAAHMIHSFAPAGFVTETPIGGYWQRRLVGIYRF